MTFNLENENLRTILFIKSFRSLADSSQVDTCHEWMRSSAACCKLCKISWIEEVDDLLLLTEMHGLHCKTLNFTQVLGQVNRPVIVTNNQTHYCDL